MCRTISLAPAPAPAIRSKRFQDEDEDSPEDDWDASSGDEKVKAAPVVAPIKKKGTLKQKLAEKAAAGASGHASDDDLIDERTPQEIRRAQAEKKAFEKAREQEADLAHAADLLGITDDADTSGFAKANPKTSLECVALAQEISKAFIERLYTKPLYTTFAEEMIRQLLTPLTDVESRKMHQVVGVIANTKTAEAKDAKSGKKKGGKAKPVLGANKALTSSKIDTDKYDEALDDDLDFM